MKNATAIGEKYPKLKTSVEECSWCETAWTQLYRGVSIENISNTCKECGRCVACCGDDGTCKIDAEAQAQEDGASLVETTTDRQIQAEIDNATTGT